MNATTQTIVSRLPARAVLSPMDIAIAYGMRRPDTIIHCIRTGQLQAARVGGRWVVARAEAERFIGASEYVPDEAPDPREQAKA